MSAGKQVMTGALFQQRAARENYVSEPTGPSDADESKAESRGNADALAFVGLLVFTLLLYVRPNDLLPGTFGTLPLAKLVVLAALFAYVVSKLSRGEPLTVWPLELKMMLVIVMLALALLPVAVLPQESINTLTDQYLKVVCVFILIINLITTRRRLRALLGLMTVCGTAMGLDAIRRYLGGVFMVNHDRIDGYTGIFADPNDLATSLNILLPLAVALALTTPHRKIKIMFLGCAAVLAVGTILTFSRGGFLGLVATGGMLVWKLTRRRRARTLLITALALIAFWTVMPGGYQERLATILYPETDQTTSAEERQRLLMRALELAGRRSIVGVGMGNFVSYSIRDKKAHNSYVEIMAELGAAGLAAYLILMLRPLRDLRQIEAASSNHRLPDQGNNTQETYYLSLGLQGAIVAYLVCSFFLSLEYLWYVYYPVACAVALRQIHAVEATFRANSIRRVMRQKRGPKRRQLSDGSTVAEKSGPAANYKLRRSHESWGMESEDA